jgi:trimethylamine--corrinoid protein Co-methyltransferase
VTFCSFVSLKKVRYQNCRSLQFICIGGIAVNDATLSVDVIREIGPFSDFLSHDNTYKYMRTQSQTRLMDRQVRMQWELEGRLSPLE